MAGHRYTGSDTMGGTRHTMSRAARRDHSSSVALTCFGSVSRGTDVPDVPFLVRGRGPLLEDISTLSRCSRLRISMDLWGTALTPCTAGDKRCPRRLERPG